MEKYVKPVMVLEEIEDEVYTIDGAVLIVSGDAQPPTIVQEPNVIN